MSVLHVARDIHGLAGRLVEGLSAGGGDPLEPAWVVVPHAAIRRWLELTIAARSGIAMNVRFDWLEQALWRALGVLAAERGLPSRRMLSRREATLLTLRALLEAGERPELAPFRRYTAGAGEHRRAWQLAERLTECFQGYRYHLPDLVSGWLGGAPCEGEAEAAQAALCRAIFAPGGTRESAARESGVEPALFLEELADEVLSAPSIGSACPAGRLHLFALAAMSERHLAIVRGLAAHLEVHVYHLSPCGLPPSEGPTAPDAASARILAQWGRAERIGAERLAEALLEPGGAEFEVREVAPTPDAGLDRDLERVQRRVVGGEASRLTCDGSVRILAAPSDVREAEAIRDDILARLVDDPTLRLDEIAVLAADPDNTLPAILATLDSSAPPLPYNCVGHGVGGSSLYAAAVRSLLGLAAGSLDRANALALFANPCFAEAVGAGPEDAETWCRWVRELGVYRSWDAEDRRERGYAASDLYTWSQGLRRLRLGTVVRPPDEFDEEWAESPWSQFPPWRDLTTSGGESLSRFDDAVEAALRRVRSWRGLELTSSEWAREIGEALAGSLAVPRDHPEEAPVAREAQAALADLAAAGVGRLRFRWVREVLEASLGELHQRRGEALTGITVLPLRPPLRLPPFRLIYVAGLSERGFPGVGRAAALDLRASLGRGPERELWPADSHAALLVEALLGARESVCLSFVSRDLQKDEDLHPSPMVGQLLRLFGRSLTGERAEMERRFEHQGGGPGLMTRVPLHEWDRRYREGGEWRTYARYASALGLAARGEEADVAEASEILEARRSAVGPAPPDSDPARGRPLRVTVRGLTDFLREPLEAGLRAQLGITDDLELPAGMEREPVATEFPDDWRFGHDVLEDYLRRAMGPGGRKAAREALPARARSLYTARARAGRLPEGGLGVADRLDLMKGIVDAAERLEGFLAERAGDEYTARLVLGGAARGAGDRSLACRVAATRLRLADGRSCEVRGDQTHLWRSAKGDLHALVATASKAPMSELPARKGGAIVPARQLLAPFVLHAALLANPDEDARQWSLGRRLRVHVVGRDRVSSWSLAPVSPGEAAPWLAALAEDALAPGAFALLPWDLILATPDLLEAAHLPGEPSREAEEAFREGLLEAIEADQGLRHPLWRRSERIGLLPDLPDRLSPRPLATVRRRLGLLLDKLEAGREEVAQ